MLGIFCMQKKFVYKFDLEIKYWEFGTFNKILTSQPYHSGGVGSE